MADDVIQGVKTDLPETDILVPVFRRAGDVFTVVDVEDGDLFFPEDMVEFIDHIVKMVDGPEVAASQEEVEAYVAKVAFEEGQTFETVTFDTAAMPHDALEIVALSHPGVSGVYQETGWTISLEAGQSMSHTARRVSFG